MSLFLPLIVGSSHLLPPAPPASSSASKHVCKFVNILNVWTHEKVLGSLVMDGDGLVTWLGDFNFPADREGEVMGSHDMGAPREEVLWAQSLPESPG